MKDADEVLRRQALIENAKLTVQHIRHCDVQVPVHRSVLEFVIQIFCHGLCVVDTFFEEESVDESTSPVAVGLHRRDVDPELLQLRNRFLLLIWLMSRQNIGI